MARLLINGEWYDALASSSHYESEYEAVLVEHAPRLFPEFSLVPFKTAVASEYGGRRPDFALIDRQYRFWWVVEAELAHHPLNHVIEQVQVFATASYGDAEARWLWQQDGELSIDALTQMMKGASPGVLVIVDSPKPECLPYLRRWNALLAVVEIFRSDRNHHVLRVNGAYPSTGADILSTCRLDPMMPRLVLLDSPANLPIPNGGRLLVDYYGSLTEWERLQAKDRVWLSPIRTNPLPPGVTFAIVQGDRGQLVFKPLK